MAKSKLRNLLCLAFLLAGCEKDNPPNSQTLFYENGTAKPIVAIVPLIDSSHHPLSWNLSDEMTALVLYRLMQKDKFYLIDQEKVGSFVKRIKETNNPFDTDLSWIKRVFFDNEFVVFMELIEHEQSPIPTRELTAAEDLPAELSMRVRVRVIDVRGEEAKVVFQEIIKDSHVIPKQFTQSHFAQVEWGKENYPISPIGIAHAQISKEIAARLEDYILLTSKRKHE